MTENIEHGYGEESGTSQDDECFDDISAGQQEDATIALPESDIDILLMNTALQSTNEDEIPSITSPIRETFLSRYNPKKYIKRIGRTSSVASVSGGNALIDSVRRVAVPSGTGIAAASLPPLATLTATTGSVKVGQWSGVVTISLIEGVDLAAHDDDGFSDPYVKFRLGRERYRSKWKPKTLNPKWHEQFDLYIYDDQQTCLEITVFDHDQGPRDDFMGRATIDLEHYSRDHTHHIDLHLEDQAGVIRLLLTISGLRPGVAGNGSSTAVNTFSRVVRKYGVFQSLRNISDVGWLQVRVLRAHDLKPADIGGKSDPFCVLELINDRLQTHTEYKTLFPEWGKVFTFNVKDIHAVLEITVYDEDRDKKVEFLGKVAIPLLRVKSGEIREFQLKDRKLMNAFQGTIELELEFVFNHFKAAVRTFNPAEKKLIQPENKFKISTLKNNVNRVYKVVEDVIKVGDFLQSCFRWESKPRSIAAFVVFLIVVWNFELYMLPVTLIIIFLKNLFVILLIGGVSNYKEEENCALRDEDDEEESKDQAKSQSFREKLQSIQDICLIIQDRMDMIASLCERVKNAFRWSVPWLTLLAIVVLSIATVVFYHVPVRYVIIGWGINKFTKKFRSPNAIDNNEVLDYLSRVPSDRELAEYREVRLEPPVSKRR